MIWTPIPGLTAFLMLRCASTMEIKSQRPKGRKSAPSPLNAVLNTLDLAQDAADV